MKFCYLIEQICQNNHRKRRKGIQGNRETIQLKLIKVAAPVKILKTKVQIEFLSNSLQRA